jgi:hypothetical protein
MNKKAIIWTVIGFIILAIVIWAWKRKKEKELADQQMNQKAPVQNFSPEIEALIGVELALGYSREEAVQLLISRGQLPAVKY